MAHRSRPGLMNYYRRGWPLVGFTSFLPADYHDQENFLHIVVIPWQSLRRNGEKVPLPGGFCASLAGVPVSGQVKVFRSIKEGI